MSEYIYHAQGGGTHKFTFDSMWNGDQPRMIAYSSHFKLAFSASNPQNRSMYVDISDIYTERTEYDEDLLLQAGYIYENTANNYVSIRMCLAFPLESGGSTLAYTAGRYWFDGEYTLNGNTTIYDGDQASYDVSWDMEGTINAEWTVTDIDFPIFDSPESWENYIISGGTDLSGCINGQDEFNQNTVDYFIYNQYQFATYKNGSPTWSGSSHGANERILAKEGSICLYKYAEPNVYMIKAGVITGSYFHASSRIAVESASTDEFTDGTLIYQSPFYDSYKSEFGDVSGNFAFSWSNLRSNTNIPIFGNAQDAQDFIDGIKTIEDAENYEYISGGIGGADNPTGTDEELTTNGINASRGVFAVDYCMSRSGLAQLGGDFFSDTYIEDMKKGLELYGNNPMNAVLQCMYFPFDISQIYSMESGVGYVHFGSYNHPVSGYGINRVLFNTGLKDLGSTPIRPSYNNFLDFTSVEIYCFLPYVGWVNLDVNKYMNTTLNIKYAIDIHSGECTAMLYSNGRLMDCYDGQCGIKQPITSEDMSAYFMAQIQGIKSAMGAVTGGAVQGAGIGAKGGAYGAVAGAVVGGGLGSVNAGVTLYGLSKMRPQLFSSGGYSGALGANLPQYPILVFCFHDVEEPANLLQTNGKPSNKSGNIGSFAGFLSVNSVNLRCGTATNDEKDEILSYLASGIII